MCLLRASKQRAWLPWLPWGALRRPRHCVQLPTTRACCGLSWAGLLWSTWMCRVQCLLLGRLAMQVLLVVVLFLSIVLKIPSIV